MSTASASARPRCANETILRTYVSDYIRAAGHQHFFEATRSSFPCVPDEALVAPLNTSTAHHPAAVSSRKENSDDRTSALVVVWTQVLCELAARTSILTTRLIHVSPPVTFASTALSSATNCNRIPRIIYTHYCCRNKANQQLASFEPSVLQLSLRPTGSGLKTPRLATPSVPRTRSSLRNYLVVSIAATIWTAIIYFIFLSVCAILLFHPILDAAR